GQGVCGIMLIKEAFAVDISGLTFAHGMTDGYGGAIYGGSCGSLTVTDCTFVGNTTTGEGGAVNVAANRLVVNNCTFTGNSADSDGGAILSTGFMSVTNSTFTGNSSGFGGAIANEFDPTYLSPPISVPTVTGCTFSGNTALFGGAIFSDIFVYSVATRALLQVTNSTFLENSAKVRGGAIYNAGDLAVSGSTFFGNSAANDYGSDTFTPRSPEAGGAIDNGLDVQSHHVGWGVVTLNNNILAGSRLGRDIYSPSDYIGVVTGSNNLIGDGSNNLIGDGRGELANTITGDPLLGPLGNYGGPPTTLAPPP